MSCPVVQIRRAYDNYETCRASLRAVTPGPRLVLESRRVQKPLREQFEVWKIPLPTVLTTIERGFAAGSNSRSFCYLVKSQES